jgi:hypothetical protein
MNLEVLAWAKDKKTWEQAITTTIVPYDGEPLAAYAYEGGVQIMPPLLTPHVGLLIDEIGEIYEAPPPPPPGEIAYPVLAAPGWHVNLRFYEPLAESLTEGLPQFDSEGKWLSLWERTHLLELFPGSVWEEDTSGIPGGYMGSKGLKLIDPMTVLSRTRIWA